MWWRRSEIAKGTASIWPMILLLLVVTPTIWICTLTMIVNPIWRWSIAIIGTIVWLGLPGNLVAIRWLSSSEYRKQHYIYRRGGPLPGCSADEPWQASLARDSLDKDTNEALGETILRGHSEEFKSNLKQEMHESVSKILGAEKPLFKCREILAEYVCGYAEWMVLGLKPEERPHLQKQPGVKLSYVSGELHRNIRYCSLYNSDLARVIHENKDVADDVLVGWANARSMAFLYLMRCINLVRVVDVKDFNASPGDERDWFQPFVQSMLICKEDDYRNKIGLPTLLPDGLAAGHASFLIGVLDGVHDPLSHWETVNGLNHSDVS